MAIIGAAGVGVQPCVSEVRSDLSNLMTGPFDCGLRRRIRGRPKVADADAVTRRCDNDDSNALSLGSVASLKMVLILVDAELSFP